MRQHRGKGDYYDDLHITSTPGATIDFSFQGSGHGNLSEKHSDLGAMEVVIDGVSEGTVSQYQNPFPLLYRVPIYRNMSLAGRPAYGSAHQQSSGGNGGDVRRLQGLRHATRGRPFRRLPRLFRRATKYEAEAGVYGSAEAFSDAAASNGAATRKLDITVGSGVKFAHVAAGTHLVIHYCTAYDPAKLSLYVNGVKVQDVTLPKTGGWEGNYQSVTVPVSIPAGAELKLQCDAGDVAANIDYIIVSQ